jgi:hypothetical protein
MPRFHSEYGEDEWIAQNLALPERGIYLDVGCGHPEHGSNTAFLRDRGWVGIATDANPDYAPHWIGRQQFCAALLAAEKKVRFKVVPENSAISRVVTDKKVPLQPAVTLEYLLTQTFKVASPPIDRIDFMSIDVEGMEFDIFGTFDWQRWRPGIIVAEYNTQDIGEDFRLRDLLLKDGIYHVAHRTVANLVYVLRV